MNSPNTFWAALWLVGFASLTAVIAAICAHADVKLSRPDITAYAAWPAFFTLSCVCVGIVAILTLATWWRNR